MPQSDQLPISFGLADIQTEQFAVIDSVYEDSEAENVQLHSDFKFGFSDGDQTILAAPRFTFNQGEKAFLILEISCIFRINDESWLSLYDKDSESLKLSKGFAAHLAAISVGIARGVLHSKTEQTPFTKFMIPLINISKNIETDLILKK